MNYRKKAILMVMALFCLNIAILAQAVSLKMDNVSVKEAMTQLKNKSGYSFVYKVGDLDTKKIITVKAKELNEAIDQILYGQDVVYEVKGKNVIVQKGQARQNTSKDGKKRKITGVVNDVNGEPIIGVTIKEKGTTNGTVSDINAKFTLEVSPGAVLELSYIGYQPLEVKVGNQTDLSIVLYEKQELLDEADHALEHKTNTQEYEVNRARGSDSQYQTKEERRVITGSEQKTSRANGETRSGQVTRRNHNGKTVITKGVTSNVIDRQKTQEYEKRNKAVWTSEP